MLQQIIAQQKRRNRFAYPTENLLGFWTNESFDETASSVVDYSINQNNAVLKTGRAFDFNRTGSGGYLRLPPDPRGVFKTVITAKCDSATGNQLVVSAEGSFLWGIGRKATITADNTWRRLTFYFREGSIPYSNEAAFGYIRVGFDDTVAPGSETTFNGHIAKIETFDLSENPLRTYYFNAYSASQAGDLTKKAFFSTSGEIVFYVGSATPVMIEQQQSFAPQIAGMNYNNYYLPRNAGYYSLDIAAGNASGYFGSCKISATFCLPPFVSGTQGTIFGTNSAYELYYVGSSTPGVINWHINGSFTPIPVSMESGIHTVEVDFSANGGAIALTIDSEQFWSGNTGGITTLNNIYSLGTGGRGSVSLFYNFSIQNSSTDRNCSFKLYGADGTQDNSGTLSLKEINSEPQYLVVPESSPNASTDAFGNSIDSLRPTRSSFNLTSASLIEITYAAAYADLQTFAIWYYHNGNNSSVLLLGSAALSVTSNALSLTGIPGNVNTYVNGQPGNSLQLGWNFIAVQTDTPFYNSGTTQLLGRSADLIFYSDPKTPSQILEILNRNKSKYGL